MSRATGIFVRDDSRANFRSWILEDGVVRPRRLGPKAPFNSPTNSLGRLNVVELTKVNWKFEREVTSFELRRRIFFEE